jgi:hypothetical protein
MYFNQCISPGEREHLSEAFDILQNARREGTEKKFGGTW